MKKNIFVLLVIGLLLLVSCQFSKEIPKGTSLPMPTNKPRLDRPYYKTLIEGEIASFPMFPEAYEDQSALLVDIYNSAGMQFYAVTDFNKLEIASPSFGNDIGTIELKLYKWEVNEDVTLTGKPLCQEAFSDYLDNTLLEFSFESLEEGEYYLAFEGIAEHTGVWMTSSSLNNTRVYYNGQVQTGSLISYIHYINRPDFGLGPISKPIAYEVPSLTPPSEIKKEYIEIGNITGVDGLNRTLPEITKKTDKERNVGIIYYLRPLDMKKTRNLADIIKNYPQLINNPNNGVWTRDEYIFWEEPIYGFYDGNSPLVYRRHAQALAALDIDFILINLIRTNELDALENFLNAWSYAEADGIKVPKIAFITNYRDQSRGLMQIKELFSKIYKEERYRNLWFYHEGKPLILGSDASLNVEYKSLKEIYEYFTFRNVENSYNKHHTNLGYWGLQSVYPQTRHGLLKDGNVEQMTVSPAQNSNYKEKLPMNAEGVFGRSYSLRDYSYTYKHMGIIHTADINRNDSELYGINFQQQWDYVIEVDPDFILVNGWNEGILERISSSYGSVLVSKPTYQFNNEYSTDIEISKGDLKDHYYYQLAANIRRYKGIAEYKIENANKTIDFSNSFADWDNVTKFNHNASSIFGVRNAFAKASVAYDRNNIYFYIETKDDISPYTDPSWMRLYIDTKESNEAWESFEFVVNRLSPTKNSLYLEKSTGGWNFETVGQVQYLLEGNKMQIKIPRYMLGIDSGWFSSKPSFNFKWTDNADEEGDISSLYIRGDSAPLGRFAYSFKG